MNSEVILFFVLSSPLLFCLILLRVSLECNEFTHEILVDVHYSCVIVEVATVVLGTEYRNKLLVLAEESIAVFHHLMSTTNQIQVMFS